MSFPNQSTLKSAIADLKEVVTRLHGADAEPIRWLSQIENSANDIESRAQIQGAVAAQALINNSMSANTLAGNPLMNTSINTGFNPSF